MVKWLFFISQALFSCRILFFSGKDNMLMSGFPNFFGAVPWFSVLFPYFSEHSLIHVLAKATGIPPDGHH
jgi:hypothetical protein